MNLTINKKNIPFPKDLVVKWQHIVNTLAEIIGVPAALIMKAEPPYMEVLLTSESQANPYKAGDREHLKGLYCERVIETQKKLLIPNALKDEDWKDNPDIGLGMISYLGFPILLPDREVFGTICVLDLKENPYCEAYERLLLQFGELAEAHLALLFQNSELEEKERRLRKSLTEIQALRGFIPICASCKKIRNDRGYWQAIETYIQDRPEAQFTHGLCPECVKKLYPELDDIDGDL